MAGNNASFRGKAVTISCTDPDQSERFYRDVLGAAPDHREGFGCKWFRLGTFLFSLMPNATEPSPATFPTHAMPILWLEVDDLQTAFRWLVQNSVRIVQAPDGQVMLISDPDGLLIEVWQAESDGQIELPG